MTYICIDEDPECWSNYGNHDHLAYEETRQQF